MSSIAGAFARGTDAAAQPHAERSSLASNKALFIGLLVVLAIIVCALAAYTVFVDREQLVVLIKDNPSCIVAALISLLLAAVPILIGFVQTTTRDRQLAKLESVSGQPAAQSRYYLVAVQLLKAIRPARLSSDYTTPMLALALVVFLGASMALLGTFVPQFFQHKSFILGGMDVLKYDLADPKQMSELVTYQQGTFVVGVMAFFGSYIYMVGRLLDRVNNNDIYPISYYYYSVRIIIACFVAAIFRHTISAFGVDSAQPLVLLGFVTGMAPDFIVISMVRKAFQYLKFAGDQRDPDGGSIPTNLSLIMIQGLSREKVDRLGELGIDNAQVLACQNPFVIWPRLPYDLGLIIDWIAQAQLYTMARETALVNLRNRCVNDIFDLHTALRNEGSREGVCRALGVEPAEAASLLQEMTDDQSFQRLIEVRDKLVPQPHEKGGTVL